MGLVRQTCCTCQYNRCKYNEQSIFSVNTKVLQIHIHVIAYKSNAFVKANDFYLVKGLLTGSNEMAFTEPFQPELFQLFLLSLVGSVNFFLFFNQNYFRPLTTFRLWVRMLNTKGVCPSDSPSASIYMGGSE